MRRLARVVGSAGLVALAAGCGSDRSPDVLRGAGDESRSIGNVWWLMFALAAGVYVLVAGLVIVAALRGRRRDEAGRGPVTRLDSRFVWLGGIGMPVVVLTVLGIVTVSTTADLRQVEPGATRIHVSGERWWWDVEYPDLGIRTANEIRIPAGVPVDLELTSDNVIHSFWVPELAGKVDLVPGQVNHLRFTAERPGEYRGQCAEYCGLAHARMAFAVIAMEPTEFGRWAARRRSPASESVSDERSAQGALVFQSQSCAGCHTVRGTEADGRSGPDLSDFGARSTIAALTVPNDAAELRRWISDPASVKPGVLMPGTDLDAADLDALVAYLESLR